MPSLAELFSVAVQQHQAGRLVEAEGLYRQILASDPRQAEAWNLLGVTHIQRGQWPAAADSFRRALSLKPDEAFYHGNLGIALKELGDREQAIASYRQALALDDTLVQTHLNLGLAVNEQGQRVEAVACYRRALALDPRFALAHYNLGNALYAQGLLAGAIECYRQAIQIEPNFAEGVHNLGVALKLSGQPDEALSCFRRAIALAPNFAEAHHSLAALLKDLGQLEESVASYVRALELRPASATAHYNLANALQEAGAREEAIAGYRRALELQPDYPMAAAALAHQLQQICHWDGLDELSRRVVDAVDAAATAGTKSGVSPFIFFALPQSTTAQQQLSCAGQWIAGQPQPAVQSDQLARPHRSAAKSRITLGYLSSDYHYHATAMLVVEMFEKHDRARFEVIGYSYGRPDDSPMRHRLVASLDRFVDVRQLSPIDTARRIAADEVDILIDLKGYTWGARPEILAARPAPVQVNYLGYPGTMGATFIDYILVDDFIVPADQQPFFTERLVHLPGCYQANDSRRAIAEHTPSRAECGLPEQGFVFCSFNNNYKITQDVFATWMRIVEAVPGSVLWLYESNPAAAANLRREAVARGVSAERLVFAPRLPLAEHQARFRVADLFLDTFPVNAHTTASESLWSGCPLLTMAGETLVARVAGSLLRAVGLPELITTSLGEYERLALHLATDPSRRAELRARLAANRTTAAVFDGGRFARSAEAAYERMWQLYKSGQPPESFQVEPR